MNSRKTIDSALRFFCGLRGYIGDLPAEMQREYLSHVDALSKLVNPGTKALEDTTVEEIKKLGPVDPPGPLPLVLGGQAALKKMKEIYWTRRLR